ncbi:MAG: hypothetical protein ACKVWR_03215, partial [Acidimicrobiales bacterium]
MNPLEDRIRAALADAGRRSDPPPALLTRSVELAHQRRRRRSAIGGAAAGSVVVAVAALLAWPRDHGRSIHAFPTDVVPVTQPAITVASAPATSDPDAPNAPTAPSPVGAANALAARHDGELIEIDPAANTETRWGTLSFRPDTPELALGADRRTVYVGRLAGAETGVMNVVRVTPDSVETVIAEGATAFALSPDGGRIALALPLTAGPDGRAVAPAAIVERNLATGGERTWEHRGYAQERIPALAYSPDGAKLAYVASFESGNVRFFALDDEPPAQPLTLQTGEASDVHDVGWAADNALMIVNRCCGVESTRGA